MSAPKTVFKGVIHGRTIELEDASGLSDGQRVQVTVQSVSQQEPITPGEGRARAFGAWAEDAEEVDRYLEWNRQQRKIGRSEIEP